MKILDVFLQFWMLCYFANSQMFDYYWREFTGEVPLDAFGAGLDNSGKNTYVLQSYLDSKGVYIATLFPGKTSINLDGEENVIHDIKILCTMHPTRLRWLNTSSETFQLDMLDKHVVVGGHGVWNGIFFIGRKMLDNSAVFGYVLGSHEEPKLYYRGNGDTEFSPKLFQVLVCYASYSRNSRPTKKG